MNDNELFEQARRRVQNKQKGRCVRNKDVIIDQEKEIQYYREKIQTMKKERELDKELEIEINNEEYLIKYNNNTDAVVLNTYLTKLVHDKELYRIEKNNEFKIINKTRMEKESFIYCI